MQVSLTATGGLERRLEVAVPAQAVTSEIETRLKQLARTSRLKGFRPGKAPLQVVRKQFGDQVRAEVVSDLMRKSFAEAVTKEQLTPAAGPRIEPIALDPGSDLKYAAVFEVMPDVKVAPFEAWLKNRSRTAQTSVRQLVSPGNRPITLVRRRTSPSERSSRFVDRHRSRCLSG